MYRKVLDLGTLPNSTSSYTSTGFAPSDLEPDSIDIKPFGYRSSDGLQLPIPYGPNDSGLAVYYLLQNVSGDYQVRVITGGNRTDYTGRAFFHYAKTADTALSMPTHKLVHNRNGQTVEGKTDLSEFAIGAKGEKIKFKYNGTHWEEQ